MKRISAMAGVLGVVVCVAMSLAAGPDAKAPASQPAVKQPSGADTPGADTSIARDQYHFPAPTESEWEAVKPDPASESITYINQAHDGAMKLDLLAKDASVDPDIAMNVAVAIVKQLKQQRKDAKTEMVMEPKIEKDKRFAFIIHEKYKVGDKTADQLHIYKSVGPRVLMLTVNTTADDPDKVADVQKTAKDLLAAVKFNRKAFKK
jgi:hypothetical protein